MDRLESRRKTPWDGDTNVTSTQAFLRQHYKTHYTEHHRAVGDSGEVDMINSYTPSKCPFCASEKFKKSGRTKSGIQRYMCGCGKTFSTYNRNHVR